VLHEQGVAVVEGNDQKARAITQSGPPQDLLDVASQRGSGGLGSRNGCRTHVGFAAAARRREDSQQQDDQIDLVHFIRGEP
jgi:hypothetical protein